MAKVEETSLSTREAAEYLGVGTTSIKRWADQGLLPCVKTVGGHRRFRERDLLRFSDADEGNGETLKREIPSLLATAVRGDPHELEAAILSLRARLGAWYRVADELGVVFQTIGEQWQSGALTIAEEHIAIEQFARCISRLSLQFTQSDLAPRCLLACVGSESHTVGLNLVELTLKEAGWKTLWAGGITPTEEIVRLLTTRDLSMVALSASSFSTDRDQLRAVCDEILPICERTGVRLVVGGSGAWPVEQRSLFRFHSLTAFHRFLSREATK